MPSHRHALLDRMIQRARAEGLNLAGTVSGTEFDRCQPRGRRAGERLPGCGTILVLGNGGRELWDRSCGHDGDLRERPTRHHLLDGRGAELAQELAAWLGEQGHRTRVVHPWDRPSLNFLQLAEMAGLGTVSPVVGMIIHPEFGLWVGFRAAILIEGTPFGTSWERPVSSGFQPCTTCARPCVQACPVRVYDGTGQIHFAVCANHRHAGACSHGCDARRACPVGAEHRYSPVEEAHRHAHSLAAMRRYYGLGLWRLVPRRLRR